VKNNIPERSTRFLGFWHTKFGSLRKSTILKISTFFQIICVEPAKVLGYYRTSEKKEKKEKEKKRQRHGRKEPQVPNSHKTIF
jgi:hypothetical protein